MAFGTLLEKEEGGTIDVLGVRFHRMTSRQVIEQVLYWISEPSRRMLITAGPEFVMMTRRNVELLRITKSADIVTPDGVGVLWAARRLGKTLHERVTGVEVTLGLLETVEQRHQTLRVYVLGATQDALDGCLKVFRDQYTTCEFRGHSGYFSPSEWPSILAEIQEFAPHLWLVGLGQPRQEMMIFEHLRMLPPCVAIGVGGSIDVWSGTVKRAPNIVRKFNLEWLYRLVTQPSRWKRQLALPRFVWQVLKNPGNDA